MIELTYNALWISYYKLARIQYSQADIEIHPDLNGHGTFKDHKKRITLPIGKKSSYRSAPTN